MGVKRLALVLAFLGASATAAAPSQDPFAYEGSWGWEPVTRPIRMSGQDIAALGTNEAYIIARGVLGAAEHELASGSFSIGAYTNLNVYPNKEAIPWKILSLHLNKPVQLCLIPEPTREVKTLKR